MLFIVPFLLYFLSDKALLTYLRPKAVQRRATLASPTHITESTEAIRPSAATSLVVEQVDDVSAHHLVNTAQHHSQRPVITHTSILSAKYRPRRRLSHSKKEPGAVKTDHTRVTSKWKTWTRGAIS